jgi:hypothetical protein
MGCNCKKTAQVLNNLNSKDHLKIAFDVYEEIVSKKTVEQYDEGDVFQVRNAFYSIYPNAKGEVSSQHAADTIKNIYNQNNGK